jgi:DNA-binding LytR/AlgR family response regulator
MKIRIETDERVDQPEVTIRCRAIDDEVLGIQTAIASALKTATRLVLTRGGKEYFLPPEQVLFFEAVDGKTFAHTASSVFETKFKLYELENALPSSFARASKSAIIGTRWVLAVKRNLAGPSLVQFRGSHKQINVSRGYYQQFINNLNERSLK